MTTTHERTTWKRPDSPAWLNIDEVLPEDLLREVEELRYECVRVFPAVKFFAERARTVAWRVDEKIREAVASAPAVYDTEAYELEDGAWPGHHRGSVMPRLSTLLALACGWAELLTSVNMLSADLDMIGRPRPTVGPTSPEGVQP